MCAGSGEGRHGLILVAVRRGLENLEHGELCKVEASWAARAVCGFGAEHGGRARGLPRVCLCLEVGWEGKRLKTTLAILLKTRLCLVCNKQGVLV